VNDYVYAVHALDTNKVGRDRMGKELAALKSDTLGELSEAYDMEIDERIRQEKIAVLERELAGKDGYSGMSDAEAKEIIDRLNKSEDAAQYRKIVKLNRDLNAWADKYAVENGLWSEADVAEMRRLYPNYVPLKGLDSPEAERMAGFYTKTGAKKGIIPSQNIQARKGRTTRATHVLAQNFADKMALIANAERNNAMMSLYDMAKRFLDPDFWVIDPKMHKTEDGKKIRDTQAEQANSVPVYINGERHIIKFKTKFGADLADNLKGLGKEQANTVLRFLAVWNRRMKAMYTSYNLEFTPVNLIRDIPYAMFTSFSDDGFEVMGKMTVKVPYALAGLLADDVKVSNYWSGVREEFEKNGGKTGGLAQVLQFRKQAEQFQSQIKDASRSRINPLKGAIPKNFNTLISIMDTINGSVEDCVRIAYYDTLRKKGFSEADAAHKAKGVTINFNRKGSASWMNEYFLFFNPAVQGIHGTLSRLGSKDKAVRKRAWIAAGTAGIGLGAAISLFNHAIAGEDDNGRNAYENIPEWVKAKNMIICIPGTKRAITVPMSYELAPFYSAGRLMMDLSRSKHFTAMDLTAGITNSILSGFNPLGSDIEPQNLSGSIVNLITPYFASPIADVAMNKNFTGRDIVPVANPFDYKPFAYRHRQGVNPHMKGFAQWLNSATGGNAHRSGYLDWSPEQMQHIMNGYLGGIGSIIQRSMGMKKTWSDEGWDAVDPRQIPLYRRFSYKADEATARYEMYKEMPYISSVYKEWDDLRNNPNTREEAKEFWNENYGMAQFYRFASKFETGITRKIGGRANKMEKRGRDEKDVADTRNWRDQLGNAIGKAELKALDKIRETTGTVKDKTEIDEAIGEMRQAVADARKNHGVAAVEENGEE
jgi:hypothetical protein